MSLQVWLTGNNSMNNQGLLGELTQTTAPTYVDGKLGKAMSTGAYKMTAEQTAQVLNNEAVSICFWIYVNAETGTSRMNMIFGKFDMGINNNRKFSLINYPTANDLHWSWMNDTANKEFTFGVLSGVLPSYQWTHVAVTYQNPNGTIYIDGEKVKTFTGVSNSSSFAYETQVISNSSYLYWNDYRIYNHCISAKEVKEISKGLVLHYPLKSQYETGQVNKYSGDKAEGNLWVNNFTKTKLEDERGYNYKLTYTGTGNSMWFSMDAGHFPFTVGKKYYYSCKVRCHSKNFNVQLRASRSANDWVTNMTNVLNPDGKWHEYVVSQIINSTYDRAGSTVTCNPVLEFYTDNLSTSGTVYFADFDIKDIQVIESDCYVPFIDNSMASTVVSDCSGYGNNGTKVGTITWSSDTARYSGSYGFDGDTSAVKTNFYDYTLDGIFTINMWFRKNTGEWSSKEWETLFGGQSGFEIESKNRKTNSPIIYAYSWGKGTFAYKLDKWNMLTVVRTTSDTKWYLNGELKLTGTSGTIPSGEYFIGAWKTSTQQNYKGNISDFRVYATALSESDIKSLYSISASIDKTGVLSVYEFVEEG